MAIICSAAAEDPPIENVVKNPESAFVTGISSAVEQGMAMKRVMDLFPIPVEPPESKFTIPVPDGVGRCVMRACSA